MEDLKDSLELIGLPSDKPFTVKDAKRVFRKKSYAMLPEKALGNQNAHSKFEELNSSFVKILKRKQEDGEKIDDVMPGEVNSSKVQIVMNLRQGSVPFWKKAVKQMYPTVIIGAQKKSNFIPGGSGKAIRFVVYWKASSEGTGQPVKVNLVLYENDLLQVSGSGFFLWTMDCYPEMVAKVDILMSEQRSEDEGIITHTSDGDCEGDEDGQVKRSKTPEEVKPPPRVIKICEAEKKFDMIIEYLENIETDFEDRCNDLKSDIEDMEFNFNDKMSNLTKRMDHYKKRYTATQEILQERLDIMDERVCAARQIAGASNMSGGRVGFTLLGDGYFGPGVYLTIVNTTFISFCVYWI